ncbi:hypothetical protein Pla110_35570 [Polystyrenella longa]|uniref:Uncharacterized protein n=1 Tax=Polystyrenella longa TaxID=2528007 RepID=A0A518CRF2_9PLAN|nr:hypothetical protein [Polystyrenella longa]QDU81807.1 hypothetical protein Pla110_35570 [Polystyrenella longa]
MIRAFQTTRSDTQHARTGRTGTTLVEVLISILLMGIGLVALATMFPAAILRTVRAHHLTSATSLRFNVETMLDMYPGYVDQWDDGSFPGAIPSPGVSGYIVVDPQGYIDALDLGSGNENLYGDTITRQTFDTSLTMLDLDRDISGAGDRDDAVLFTTSSDTWEPLVTAAVESFVPPYEYVDVDPKADLTGINDMVGNQTGLVRARAILFSSTGKGAEYRFLTGVEPGSPNRIHWSETFDSVDRNNDGDATDTYPVASTFSPERVQLEVSDPRLSWLMSVRRTYIDGTQVNNNADIVVFFNRSFEPDSETVYTGSTLTIGSAVAEINASDLEPPPKVGNFIFDAEKCHWYKIVSVESTNPYVVSIDRPAVKSSTKLMLVRNVIDVYPLKAFTTD